MTGSRGALDILVVDDQPANVALLSKVLSDGGYRVRGVTSGARAVEAALLARPDCVLLDVSMPDMDGFATCTAFQARAELRDVPIVFLTAHDDLEHKVRGFQVGARDYITKPFQAEEVLARVSHQVRLAELEHQLRTRNEELIDANQRLLEAAGLKARMTAMLVHDLRTPLTVIGWVLGGEAGDEGLADAREAHAKVTRLITDMLELSRTEHGEAERLRLGLDLGQLLERVGRIAERGGAAKQIKVHLVPPRERVEVSGDLTQLDRVFSNLLDNALKFTPPGGEVTISLRVEDGEGVESGLRFATVRVVDTGPGIPPEDLPFIFDAYSQSTGGRASGGFGLGLSIVARIVAQHGGRIRAHSQVGVGTEFRVMLPINRSA